MAKLIKAVFGAGQMSRTCPQWQYDYNTTLQFVGLDLPATFEVDLANSKTGQSTTVLGDADGCCTIPAQYFIPGTSIFAWVYIVDSNSGYTRCQVEIPIHPRAQHTGDPPTPEQQSALDQAIALLNAATENIPNEINTALQEAKESGEFDGTDGTHIWWTTARVLPYGSGGGVATRQLNGVGGEAPAVRDYVFAPEIEQSGEPTTLYVITKTTAVATAFDRICRIKGDPGDPGEDGATFTPSVSYEGVISWTNDKGLPNPAPVNIKGKTGEPGAPGAPGVPGDDYILTDEDRADIALDVAETVLERATVSGNPLVISDGVGGTRPLSLLCEVEAAEAVTLTRTGKNIWDSARFLEADGWTLEEDGSFSGYNSDLYYSFGRRGKSMFGNTAWNEQVTVSFDLRKVESSTAENAIEIVLNYADGTKTSQQNRGSSTWQHCSVSSTLWKTIASIQFTYGSKAKIWLKDFQVEFSGASTGYQPYAATVYQLPIPDAPASGTIDLTDAARDAVTMLAGANVVFADCTSLTMTYPVRPAGSGGNVQSVNGKTGEVVLSASDVHALPDTTEIPSRTSQLQNDSGYLTQHQSLAAYRTSQAQDEIDQQQNTAIVAKYAKPSGGIPKSDLASAVQTSLGKADTALQSETDPTVPSWAKASSKPSYTASEVGAVAVAQGTVDANKVLTVDIFGNVVPEDPRIVVTFTPTSPDYSGTIDWSPAALAAAYDAGKRIIAYAPAYNFRCELSLATIKSGGLYTFDFIALGELNGQDIMLRLLTSDSASTYTAKLYPLATSQWTGGSY